MHSLAVLTRLVAVTIALLATAPAIRAASDGARITLVESGAVIGEHLRQRRLRALEDLQQTRAKELRRAEYGDILRHTLRRCAHIDRRARGRTRATHRGRSHPDRHRPAAGGSRDPGPRRHAVLDLDRRRRTIARALDRVWRFGCWCRAGAGVFASRQ